MILAIEHIKGKDNVVADALSRVSITNFKELDDKGNEWLKSKVQKAESDANVCMKMSKRSKRETNQILAITRSMTRKPTNNNVQTEFVDKTVRVTEDLSYEKRANVPRIRTTKLELSQNGDPITIALSAYLKHKKVFNIELDNERLTMNLILSTLEREMRAKTLNL